MLGAAVRGSRRPGALTGTRYYAFGGTTVALRDGTGVSYLIGDVQGSATVLIPAGDGTGDPDAVVASRNAYTPYGVTRGDDNLATDRGWLGQVEDQSSGLTYLNARYYDPAIARFISPDPLMDPTDPRTLDPYRYADNNPVVFTDPGGLAPSCSGLTGQAYKNCSGYATTTYNYMTGKTTAKKNEELAKSGKAGVNKTTPKKSSKKSSKTSASSKGGKGGTSPAKAVTPQAKFLSVPTADMLTPWERELMSNFSGPATDGFFATVATLRLVAAQQRHPKTALNDLNVFIYDKFMHETPLDEELSQQLTIYYIREQRKDFLGAASEAGDVFFDVVGQAGGTVASDVLTVAKAVKAARTVTAVVAGNQSAGSIGASFQGPSSDRAWDVFQLGLDMAASDPVVLHWDWGSK